MSMLMTEMQAEGLLNALRDSHECGAGCIPRCTLADLEPALPADRAIIAAMSRVAA